MSPKQTKCNVNELQYLNPNDFVCNEITGFWVVKDSNEGRMLIDLDVINKHESPVLSTKKVDYYQEPVVECSLDKYPKIFYPQILYMKKLPKTHIDALYNYTEDQYVGINELLRGTGLELDNDLFDDVRSINILDEIFRGIPPLKHNIVLWRGSRMKTGIPDHFTDKGFMSTSIDRDIALDYNKVSKCCLFEIHVPKGTKVIPLGTCSGSSDEMEVLLPRNGSYTVLNSTSTMAKTTMVVKYEQDVPTKKFTYKKW